VELAAPAAGTKVVFRKTGPRPALEIALVSLAFAYRAEGGALR